MFCVRLYFPRGGYVGIPFCILLSVCFGSLKHPCGVGVNIDGKNFSVI